MDTINKSYTLFLEPYDPKRLASLCGYCGENLKLIEHRLNVEIHSRGNYFEVVELHPTSKASDALSILKTLYEDAISDSEMLPNSVHLRILEQLETTPEVTEAALDIVEPSTETCTTVQLRSHMDKQSASTPPATNDSHDIEFKKTSSPSVAATKGKGEIAEIHTHRKVVRLRSNNQKLYARNIAKYDINFGIGPAGTGKTYLAVAAAVNAFKNDEVKRILLIRPAVEAGEKLGFLPGDLSEKVNPYLRPLYDALYEMLGFEQVAKLIDRQIIEVCPLAYMRGRTLSDAFIILDESQNTTAAQMKMLLTRIGFGSKAVITGDITQIDLPRGQMSGLHHALQVLDGVKDIGVTKFASCDVVRHPLVKTIIEAYDEEEAAH